MPADVFFQRGQEQGRAALPPEPFPNLPGRLSGAMAGVDQRITAGSMTPLQQEQGLSRGLLGGQTGIEARDTRLGGEAAFGQQGAAWAGAFKARAPTHPFNDSPSASTTMEEYVNRRQALAGQVAGGLQGDDLTAANASIGTWIGQGSPTNTFKGGFAATDQRLANRRQGLDFRGNQLDQGQLGNIASREQDLGRRQLRSTLLGMGQEHRLTDTQADEELRKQGIMGTLKQEGRDPTMGEVQALGGNVTDHPDAMRLSALAQAQTPEGVAAAERMEFQKRLGGGDTPPQNPNTAFAPPTLTITDTDNLAASGSADTFLDNVIESLGTDRSAISAETLRSIKATWDKLPLQQRRAVKDDLDRWAKGFDIMPAARATMIYHLLGLEKPVRKSRVPSPLLNPKSAIGQANKAIWSPATLGTGPAMRM